jgi:hypothetical protein
MPDTTTESDPQAQMHTITKASDIASEDKNMTGRMEQGHGKQEQHKDIVFPKPDTRAAVDQSSALQLQQTALAPYSPQKSSGPGFDKENERVSLREMFASNIPLSERKHLDELLEQACLPKPPILMVCLRCFTVKEKILTLGSDL